MPRTKQEQQERAMCECGKRHVAINYKKDGITHYRTTCSSCAKKLAIKKKNHYPNYNLKSKCEKCGFVPIYKEQLSVFFDAKDNILKTVCLNCNEELRHVQIWKQGDLVEDF